MADETIDMVLNMLEDDIVSHGFLIQSAIWPEPADCLDFDKVETALTDLLKTGKVEIISAMGKDLACVQAIAWKGSIEDRIDRAKQAVTSAVGRDKEFAYWICLSKNIDRFEGD